MKIIGWIGILHVFIITVWIGINIIFGMMNPVTISNNESISELGMMYYSNFPGYLGLDHGSKALIMLLSVVLPIGLFTYLKRVENFKLLNMIGLVSGSLGFALYGLSLMLQAVTVEYAFSLYRSTPDEVTHKFAELLYEWSMLEGGLSVSIYILANLGLSAWMIIHSYGLYTLNVAKKLSIFGYIVGGLQIVGFLISWFFLMLAKQNMHDFNEAIGLLFTLWLLLISIKMIRGKLTT